MKVFAAILSSSVVLASAASYSTTLEMLDSRIANNETTTLEGTVTVNMVEGTTVNVAWDLVSADGATGGIHIHTGTSCADADYGGHYWAPASAVDPWIAAKWTGLTGSVDVETGIDWADQNGRALVVHSAADNKPFSCGILALDAVEPTNADAGESSTGDAEDPASETSTGEVDDSPTDASPTDAPVEASPLCVCLAETELCDAAFAEIAPTVCIDPLPAWCVSCTANATSTECVADATAAVMAIAATCTPAAPTDATPTDATPTDAAPTDAATESSSTAMSLGLASVAVVVASILA